MEHQGIEYKEMMARKIIKVRNSIKTISVEVRRYDGVGQTLWILLNNQKQKIRNGAIYELQENLTPNNQLKLLYRLK